MGPSFGEPSQSGVAAEDGAESFQGDKMVTYHQALEKRALPFTHLTHSDPGLRV